MNTVGLLDAFEKMLGNYPELPVEEAKAELKENL